MTGFNSLTHSFPLNDGHLPSFDQHNSQNWRQPTRQNDLDCRVKNIEKPLGMHSESNPTLENRSNFNELRLQESPQSLREQEVTASEIALNIFSSFEMSTGVDDDHYTLHNNNDYDSFPLNGHTPASFFPMDNNTFVNDLEEGSKIETSRTTHDISSFSPPVQVQGYRVYHQHDDNDDHSFSPSNEHAHAFQDFQNSEGED